MSGRLDYQTQVPKEHQSTSCVYKEFLLLTCSTDEILVLEEVI